MPASEPQPPYTYVPGHSPHPLSDPRGHAYGCTPESVTICQPDWWTTPAYIAGEQLFRAGYYWEAHEAWESVWHALGRTGSSATHVKGLIKLAASGVKCLEGNEVGALRHARRAAELLDAGEAVPHADGWRRLARRIAQKPPVCCPASTGMTPHPLEGFTPDWPPAGSP